VVFRFGLNRVAALSAIFVLAAGCSDDTAPPSPTNDAEVECTGDPRADAYAANMEKLGEGGIFTFRLVSSDPAPPVKGTNAWTIDVLDTSGAPVDGMELDVTPYMPDHGHGTSIVPQITDMGAGEYSVTPLYLFMGGIWEVTIEASDGDASSDSAVFTFCIRS
jgi:hypothetical protein